MKSSPTLQQLITSRLTEKNLSRSQIVKQIGYSNVSKGIRKFDTYLKTLSAPSDEFVSSLLSVLNIDGLAFHNACIASHGKMNADASEKAERSFRSFLEVIISIQIRPFFAAQAIRSQCMVPVPDDIQFLPFKEEIDAVVQVYKSHIDSTECLDSLQDKITGFRYNRKFDSAMVFDTEFTLTENVHIRPATANKMFGNKVIDLMLNVQQEGR